MVTVICQHTGIEFEAASKRQKNHPAVAALLASANEDGTYRVAVQRLAAARAAGMTEIDAIVRFVQTGEKAALARRAEIQAADRRLEQERAARHAAAMAQRDATNSILREAGFRWLRYEEREEAVTRWGVPEFGFVLVVAATNEVVPSVEEAMRRGAAAGNVRCRAWLEK